MPTEGAIGFSDIVGFTEFTAAEGDERAIAVLDLQTKIVTRHLGSGDRVVKELGDGLLLWFEDAASAVESVVAMQADLREAASNSEIPVWIRIGLHWGCPTERGDDLIGHDVNLASRVSDQAGPGEVVLTEPLLRAAGALENVTIAPLGPIRMKGIPDPVWLYRAG
jgi:adenylate cyclase